MTTNDGTPEFGSAPQTPPATAGAPETPSTSATTALPGAWTPSTAPDSPASATPTMAAPTLATPAVPAQPTVDDSPRGIRMPTIVLGLIGLVLGVLTIVTSAAGVTIDYNSVWLIVLIAAGGLLVLGGLSRKSRN